jgi:phosphoribosylglycinamide formyltransferase-1
VFEIGWFSSGRDEAAKDLLKAIFDEIQSGNIKGKISFVFITRDKGEKPESDEFIELAENFGLNVICVSHRKFKPELRKAGLENTEKTEKDSLELLEWRKKFDEKVIKKLEGYTPDLVVLAGYMLITSPELCNRYNMINLHPALPGGPKGTWQEVIWQLMEDKAKKTGVMMHLVTPKLDAGPPITYCEFSISDEEIKPLWDRWESKRAEKSLEEIQKTEGEDEPLFKEIRRRGLMREFPLIIATLKAAAEGDFSIINGEIIARGKKLYNGFNLTEKIERSI